MGLMFEYHPSYELSFSTLRMYEFIVTIWRLSGKYITTELGAENREKFNNIGENYGEFKQLWKIFQILSAKYSIKRLNRQPHLIN